MDRNIVILHGYSDDQESFQPLADFLKKNGFKVMPIFLGDYVTLEDTITIEDLAKAFRAALAYERMPTGARSFDLIVHSTGALVAREWLTRYYLEAGKESPLAHFLMLAPANFGSPLAHMGRTMFGRLIKGWKSGFEVGTEVLKALELASPYTWNLAQRDVFARNSFYSPEKCMTAVLVGSMPYQGGFRQLVNRNGSDGTVYVCTANLNAGGVTVRFGSGQKTPILHEWGGPPVPIAFGVFEKLDHATICRPDENKDLGRAMLDFLRAESPEEYGLFRDRCGALTGETLPASPEHDYYHTYENVVARVSDDLGHPVEDYFLEFYEKPQTEAAMLTLDALMVKVHREILEDVHPYKENESYRSFLFDLTDLFALLQKGGKLMFSLSAADPSGLVGYSTGGSGSAGELPVFEKKEALWRPNQTLLLNLVIERTQKPEVFVLKKV